MSEKRPNLGASRACVLSPGRLALPCSPAGFLYPRSFLSNLLQSWCFKNVSLAIFNFFCILRLCGGS